jgi:hypothetical protein
MGNQQSSSKKLVKTKSKPIQPLAQDPALSHAQAPVYAGRNTSDATTIPPAAASSSGKGEGREMGDDGVGAGVGAGNDGREPVPMGEKEVSLDALSSLAC